MHKTNRYKCYKSTKQKCSTFLKAMQGFDIKFLIFTDITKSCGSYRCEVINVNMIHSTNYIFDFVTIPIYGL